MIFFLKIHFVLIILIFFQYSYSQQISTEARKSYLEDIFIWKMSDELKLSVADEKKFSEIHKELNRKKSDLNKDIQASIDQLDVIKSKPEAEINKHINTYKNLLKKYNQLSVEEAESMHKLLGSKKFLDYLQVKNEITNKVKSMLIGEKKDNRDEKPMNPLPPPKIIQQ